MIESIEVSKEASFGDQPQVLSGLTKINYVFGANATGKTTISRVISDASWSSHCQVHWYARQPLQTLVYNKDFIKRNFEETDRLKGIFTLGEEHISVREKIEAAKKEHEDLVREIDGLTKTLDGEDGSGGKREELRQVDERFRDRCWAQKQKHDQIWAGAFSGYRNSQDNFMAKVLEEASDNEAALRPLEELRERADTIFGPAPLDEPLLSSPDFSALLANEEHPILARSVVGASDVPIASLIERLGCSDWVRRGTKYLKEEPTACPFCQQEPPKTLEGDLEDYFDEGFEKQTRAIADLVAAYRKGAEQAIGELEDLQNEPSHYLDKDKLSVQIALFQSIIDKNLAALEGKEEEPSRKAELDSVQEPAAVVAKLVEEANVAAEAHNETVANLSVERERLRGEVWRYILDEELADDIETYENDRRNLRKAIESLEGQIQENESDRARKLREIEELERTITSVQPTVDAINRLLKSFGFLNFRLATVDDGAAYQLIRPDGSEARQTLSEGERTFVTFLYFFYGLKGSHRESGTVQNRVVVFDDPVSSLDSDILFVVSTLIRGLCDEVTEDEGQVKQILILTHNVYFHRQVTYGHEQRKGRHTFWIVRKDGDGSFITEYERNPVRSSYELLWAELSDQNRSNFAVQNAMRRILEHYFTLLGGVSLQDLVMEFDGDERRICSSLVSWMHAGSHHVDEDIYVSVDNTTIDAYLRVFQAVFEKCNHQSHYDMMMARVTAPRAESSIEDGE